MSGTQGDGVNTGPNAAGRRLSSLDDENSRRKVQNVRARSPASARSVERARIILAADGWLNQDIAVQLQMTPARLARWRGRFLTKGPAALDQDAPRSGRPRTITAAQERAVVRKTT